MQETYRLSVNGAVSDPRPGSRFQANAHKPTRRAAAREVVRAERPEMSFLTVEEVEGMISCTRNLLYALEKKGQFPNRIRISHQCVRYKLTDVQNWIAEQQQRTDAVSAFDDEGKAND